MKGKEKVNQNQTGFLSGEGPSGDRQEQKQAASSSLLQRQARSRALLHVEKGSWQPHLTLQPSSPVQRSLCPEALSAF